MIDISEKGLPIRPRLRRFYQSMVAEKGMIFGHLKAYQRVQLKQYYNGHVEGSDGCQDFELSLRIAKREAILMIPEPLYYYRWHPNSQSVSKSLSQSAKTSKIISDFLDKEIYRSFQQPLETHEIAAPVDIGVCIICLVDDLKDLSATLQSVLSSAPEYSIQILFIGPIEASGSIQDRNFKIIANIYPEVDIVLLDVHDNSSLKIGERIKAHIDQLQHNIGDGNTPREFLILASGDELNPLFREKVSSIKSFGFISNVTLLRTQSDRFRVLTGGSSIDFADLEVSYDVFIFENTSIILAEVLVAFASALIAEINILNPRSVEFAAFEPGFSGYLAKL